MTTPTNAPDALWQGGTLVHYLHFDAACKRRMARLQKLNTRQDWQWRMTLAGIASGLLAGICFLF